MSSKLLKIGAVAARVLAALWIGSRWGMSRADARMAARDAEIKVGAKEISEARAGLDKALEDAEARRRKGEEQSRLLEAERKRYDALRSASERRIADLRREGEESRKALESAKAEIPNLANDALGTRVEEELRRRSDGEGGDIPAFRFDWDSQVYSANRPAAEAALAASLDFDKALEDLGRAREELDRVSLTLGNCEAFGVKCMDSLALKGEELKAEVQARQLALLQATQWEAQAGRYEAQVRDLRRRMRWGFAKNIPERAAMFGLGWAACEARR